MRRTGNLFDRILERDNLRTAACRALMGKRHRPEARRFVAHLEQNLARLRDGLATGTYPVGRSSQFVLHDPKERVITAPCFAERVLHHAVMNVCEPVFDHWLIDDTYACRKGKGRIACLLRAREHSRRHPFFLKLDIRKYFDSIPHAVLTDRIGRLFKEPSLLALLARIIGAFRASLGRGLPIGSLTSQHFANFYLGWFDRFVKERLRVRGYVRYMDDMVLWGGTTAELLTHVDSCRKFLADELQLDLKPWWINQTHFGIDFLGYRVFSTHLILNRRSRVRYRRNLMKLELSYLAGEIDESTLQQRATALTAFTRTEGVKSWRFRTRVIERLPVGGHTARTG